MATLHISRHEVRMQAPPTALIFFSASAEKNRALTTIGHSGKRPFPRTFENPFSFKSKHGALPCVREGY